MFIAAKEEAWEVLSWCAHLVCTSLIRTNMMIAPKHISQHIIVTHSPAISNVDNGAAPTSSTRFSVPKHLLKHQFVPFGASLSADNIRYPTDTMDIDVPAKYAGQKEANDEGKSSRTIVEQRTPKKKHSQSTGTGDRKRKNVEGESETPKHKAKKLKV